MERKKKREIEREMRNHLMMDSLKKKKKRRKLEGLHTSGKMSMTVGKPKNKRLEQNDAPNFEEKVGKLIENVGLIPEITVPDISKIMPTFIEILLLKILLRHAKVFLY